MKKLRWLVWGFYVLLNSLRVISFVAGILLIGISAVLLYQHYSPQRIAFASEKLVNSGPVRSHLDAKTVHIPVATISLPVFEGQIIEGKWQVSSQGITHLLGTVSPGELGNSVFYGHNWTSLLGPLTQVKPDDLIQIEFSDGSMKDFKVKYTFEVSPNESSIIENTDFAQLTIYTCSGFLDSKRFVVIAVPINSYN